jgi:hypothetical protein
MLMGWSTPASTRTNFVGRAFRPPAKSQHALMIYHKAGCPIGIRRERYVLMRWPFPDGVGFECCPS